LSECKLSSRFIASFMNWNCKDCKNANFLQSHCYDQNLQSSSKSNGSMDKWWILVSFVVRTKTNFQIHANFKNSWQNETIFKVFATSWSSSSLRSPMDVWNDDGFLCKNEKLLTDTLPLAKFATWKIVRMLTIHWRCYFRKLWLPRNSSRMHDLYTNSWWKPV